MLRATRVAGASSQVPGLVASLNQFECAEIVNPPNGVTTLRELVLSLPSPLDEWAPDSGITGLRSVIDGWAGGAADTELKCLYAHGGGHNNSANNGLYRYTFGTGWEFMPNSLSPISEVPTTVETHDVYNDGLPTSVHPYSGIALDTVRKRFYRFGGSAWRSGNATGAHWYYDLENFAWVRIADASIAVPTYPKAIVDPVTGKLAATSSARTSLAFYRPDDDTWSSEKSWGGDTVNSGDSFMAWDAPRGVAHIFGAGEYRRFAIDFENETVSDVSGSITLSGATDVMSRVTLGAAYDSVESVWWLYGGQTYPDHFQSVFKFDPVTGVISEHALSGYTPEFDNLGSERGPFGRLLVVPEWGALCGTFSVDAGAMIVRLR